MAEIVIGVRPVYFGGETYRFLDSKRLIASLYVIKEEPILRWENV